jgi:hypothetical protein
VNDLILKQAVEPDAATRTDIEKIQELVAGDLSTVPLLQGAQVAVTGKDVRASRSTRRSSCVSRRSRSKTPVRTPRTESRRAGSVP